MIDTPHIAGVAHLIGDPTRAIMLSALKHDECLSATELARVAGVAPSTASGHLSILVHGKLVVVDPAGRHRYYRLAAPVVADALEAMAALAVAALPADNLGPPADPAIRFARVCFDHLAGELAVALCRSLIGTGCLKESAGGFRVTALGRALFAELGIDLDLVSSTPRLFARKCPDWSEQHPHIGGALGAAILKRLKELEWLRTRAGDRSVSVTARGRLELAARFGVGS